MKLTRCAGWVFLILAGVGVPAVWGQDAVGELEKRLDDPPAVEPAEAAPAAPAAELPEPARAPAPAADAAAADRARPSLGISVDDVRESLRSRFAVTVSAGAVITQIRPGTPAARAGLPLGGVIVSVNGKRIGSADDLVQYIQAFRPGDSVELTYFEGDRIGRKKLTLAPVAPATAPKPSATKSLTTDPSDPPLRLGRPRAGAQPNLDALERQVDGTMLPGDDAGGGAGAAELAPPLPAPAAPADTGADPAVEPPPPPAPDRAGATPGRPQAALQPDLPRLPTDDTPKSVLKPGTNTPALSPAEELAELRRQRESLRKQLQEIQRRIEALERKR